MEMIDHRTWGALRNGHSQKALLSGGHRPHNGILDKPEREVNPGSSRHRRVTGLLVVVAAGALAGCAGVAPTPSSSSGVLYIGPQPQRWQEVVRANPLGPTDNIKGVQLLQQPAVSQFLVQIRDREQPHIHQEHDATIVMLRGRGRLVLKDRILIAREGDILFIPKGTVHYYVNDGQEPTVVLAIFSPAYDGKDAEVVPFRDRPTGSP